MYIKTYVSLIYAFILSLVIFSHKTIMSTCQTFCYGLLITHKAGEGGILYSWRLGIRSDHNINSSLESAEGSAFIAFHNINADTNWVIWHSKRN